jgi:dolichol kinase
MTLAVAFFSREVAVSGILVLALADPAASYVGQRWGRRPFLGASLEGTALFAAVAFAVLAPRHGLLPGAVGALAMTLAERLSWPLDDNLTIPVVGAAVLTLLQGV